jgi:hypothetical protein
MGVNLGANLPAVTLTLLVLGWVGSSIGVLVGSLFASEDRCGLCSGQPPDGRAGRLLVATGNRAVLQIVALCLPTAGRSRRCINSSASAAVSAVVTPLAVLLAFGAGRIFWLRASSRLSQSKGDS